MKPHIFGIYDCLGDVHIQFGSRGIYPVRDNYEVEITVYNNDHMVGQRLGIRYYSYYDSPYSWEIRDASQNQLDYGHCLEGDIVGIVDKFLDCNNIADKTDVLKIIDNYIKKGVIDIWN